MSISNEAAWEKARTYIDDLIEAARRRESPEAFTALGLDPHLSNCLEWLHKLEQAPKPAVLIATYGHDIDRALVNRVRRDNYTDQDRYKSAHAEHSAHVLCSHLAKIDADPNLTADVKFLVRNHDTPYEWVGRTPESTLGLILVKSADGLSFFDKVFDMYVEQVGDLENVVGKMNLMYAKMCGRTFEEMRANVPRRLSSGIQPEVKSRVEEIQRHAEEMVEDYYERAVRKVNEASKKYDPRRDTQIIDLGDITSS